MFSCLLMATPILRARARRLSWFRGSRSGESIEDLRRDLERLGWGCGGVRRGTPGQRRDVLSKGILEVVGII